MDTTTSVAEAGSLDFLNLLNETYVSFVNDLDHYGWTEAELPGYLGNGSGWEAVSWTGEIRVFFTQAEANAWRVAECREALGVSA